MRWTLAVALLVMAVDAAPAAACVTAPFKPESAPAPGAIDVPTNVEIVVSLFPDDAYTLDLEDATGASVPFTRSR